ncbi:shufflon system plasmid conjugative transfer pilus tip adhesin PilV [Desulfovibrio sp. JC022]|uniref:shufflon system plasmid conjugative transfer pilus tip adhesin PilV n=1 Tax=Desulfovibrio sp. JC022 TaxID=2593642 RepID=UPI0013D76E26|nr:shufflon system plasmid conjugative transfer pilus tip adhesin PilV [Desulfovibrio sp. JC022]NDV23130.1 shufflon system plasmid conjugative transfer pilus tip adhesin PilV [Desulfovibrio sp. JC022]
MTDRYKIKQHGFTLIEVLAALIILAMLMPLLGDFIDRGVEQIKQRNVSNHLAAVLDAASDYAKENYSDLTTSSTASGATAVTMTQLRTGGFLPNGFQDLNGWGQRYGIYVLQPSVGDLQVLVLTYAGRTHSATDKNFSTTIAPATAAMVGGAGGYIPTGEMPGQSASELRGSFGGWTVDLAATDIPVPAPGHIGGRAFLREKDISKDFLYRVEVPGHPELNEMATELDMTDHAIENVKEIHFEKHTLADIDTSGFCGDADKEGRVFFDPAVGLYICRAGEPQVIADSGNSQFLKGSTVAINGELIPKPTCAPGVSSTPQIFVAPAAFAEGSVSKSIVAVQCWATSEDADNWRVHMRIRTADSDSSWISPPAGTGRIMVLTTCN